MGSCQLFDDGAHSDGRANDGNFANVYANTDKEGSYTWRFYIEGKLANGSPFHRLITLSKWVGIQVDPNASSLSVNYGLAAPRGSSAAQIFLRPQDIYGNYLGPFRPSDLRFDTTVGHFLSVKELPPLPDGLAWDQDDGVATISHFDGRYSRVLVYPSNQTPVVTVIVQDKPYLPMVIASGCLGKLLLWIRNLWQWLIRLMSK